MAEPMIPRPITPTPSPLLPAAGAAPRLFVAIARPVMKVRIVAARGHDKRAVCARRSLRHPPLPSPTEVALSLESIEVAVIGTGWCGGIRAETLARHPLTEALHIAEINEVRLKEVAA